MNKKAVSTLEELIAPYSEKEFVERYWEQEILYIPRNDPSYFDLLSVEEFESLIRFGAPREVNHEILASRIVDGAEEEEKFYLDSRERDFWMKVYNLHLSGYTLLYNYVERRQPKIAKLAKDLELFAGAYSWANIFFSPPSKARGFPVHYDGVEIFVLQLHGHKRWQIYKPQYELPHVALIAPRVQPEKLEKLLEIELQPGDTLYLPRGYIHAVESLDHQAMHLTLSIEPCRWMDLLIETVQQLTQDDIDFRRSARLLGRLSEDAEVSIEKTFEQLKERILLKANLQKTRAKVEAEIIAKTSPLAQGYFSTAQEIITPQTMLKKRDDLLFKFTIFVKPDGEEIKVLLHSGNVISIPNKLKETLEYILSKTKFQVANFPRTISTEENLKFAQQLIDQGFLTTCPSPQIE
jgi:ribosomal protein L16 Arg81 hydroxylase